MAEPLIGREDDLDDHNYQVREVFAQYGLTSYESQVMERGVVNALTLKANIDSAEPTQESFDELFDKFAKYTLPPTQVIRGNVPGRARNHRGVEEGPSTS